MIKAVVTTPSRGNLVIFGLSGENVTRIAAGEPIRIPGEHIGIPGTTFVICYGKTEADIVAELQANGVSIDLERKA